METHRLKNLRISRISTVDHPDNPPADIVLFKRKRDMATDNVTAEDIAKLPENVQKLIKDLTEKAEQSKDTEEATGLLAKIKGLFTSESNAPEPDEVIKGADPQVQKAYEAMRKLAASAEATAQATQDRLDRNDMIDIAKGLPHLGKVDDVAGELLVLKRNLPEGEWETFLKRQKGTAALLKDSALFKEQGAGDAGTATGEDAIEAIAKGLRAKDPNLSKAEAFLKALESDEGRAAYKQHDEEKGGH